MDLRASIQQLLVSREDCINLWGVSHQLHALYRGTGWLTDASQMLLCGLPDVHLLWATGPDHYEGITTSLPRHDRSAALPEIVGMFSLAALQLLFLVKSAIHSILSG